MGTLEVQLAPIPSKGVLQTPHTKITASLTLSSVRAGRFTITDMVGQPINLV